MSYIEIAPTCSHCGKLLEDEEEVYILPADDEFDEYLYVARCERCHDKIEADESEVDA